MPGTWRVRVVQARLKAAGIAAQVVERSLLELEGADRHAALDAMVREGAEPPFVLVGGALACSGGIDPDAVVAAAKRLAT